MARPIVHGGFVRQNKAELELQPEFTQFTAFMRAQSWALTVLYMKAQPPKREPDLAELLETLYVYGNDEDKGGQG